MSKLFHYTSNAGAIGIIQSQCLFATHYRFLNDTEELQIIRSLLEPIFEQDFREEYRKWIDKGRASNLLEQDHGADVYQKEARRLIDAGLRVTDKVTPVFITSFCRHTNPSHEWENGLLSQWRGYGSTGGCALQFDQEILDALVAHERDTYAHTTVKISDVIYEKHEDAFAASEIEGLAKAFLAHIVNRSKSSKKAYDERMPGLYRSLAVIAPTLKKSSFREEMETRIVAPSMTPEAAKEFPMRTRRPIAIRYVAGLPVPYIKLFEDGAPLPIERIIVGPQQSQERVVMALDLVLKEAGLSKQIQIVKSDISYLP